MSRLVHRREFLHTLAAGAAAAQLGAGEVLAAERNESPLVDCHVHCFAGKGDSRFPYHPRGTYQPEKPSTPERLIECLDAAGFNHAIIVHPEPYQDDHRYLEHCLAVGGKRLKGTCLFFASDAEAPARMKALAAKCPLVAGRIHAHLPDRLPPFGQPELKRLWQAIGDLGLAVQLHFAPQYAEGFEPLIREFPKFPVIIDHLGRTPEGTAAQRERILGWSRFPNTIFKLSAFTVERQPDDEVRDAIVRQATAAFGPERMIYGNAFGENATGQSMRAHVARARQLLAHLSAADQDKILGGNAMRLFRLNS
jgi:predicted TIM-barrel fold metal-dependent hydrolase